MCYMSPWLHVYRVVTFLINCILTNVSVLNKIWEDYVDKVIVFV